MKNEISLERLPLAAFAQEGGESAGSLPLSQLTRLAEESLVALNALTTQDEALGRVDYAFSGEMRQNAAAIDEPWIQLQASTTLRLTCQRCLSPVDLNVNFSRTFRFVVNEELAAAEDEASEEDVLVLAKQFDIAELIEDELLMAMPLVPMHEVCPQPVKLQAADPDFEAEPAEKPNPFAVLSRLKSSDS